VSPRFLKLAVDAPLLNALTYQTSQSWPVGSSVTVPLGKRSANAVILGEGKPSSDFEIKEISSLDESRPNIQQIYLRWLEWLADYYVYPIGQVVSLTFPPLAPKKIKSTDVKKSQKPPTPEKTKKPEIIKKMARTLPLDLTLEQQKCLSGIQNSPPGFQVHLIHGVTGSGKTEVYLRILDDVLSKNKTGLILVPEISLTPQLIQRFAERFGDQIAVLHSHLTDRERTDQWWSVVNGEKKILIGARSALFCPIPNLGLIIVDEEHEPSYKQEEKFKYNARDAAVALSKFLNIPIVLGSATPSLESWHNAQSGKYKVYSMNDRVGGRSLPEVQIVDLRNAKIDKRESKLNNLPFWMSNELYELLSSTLEKHEQSALFLNRRGFAPTVLCGGCGFIHKCPNCAISLTLHGKKNLVCHYCDYAVPLGVICPSCKVDELKTLGLGTEQIEDDIQKLFPNARLARADRDEIHSRETLEALIQDMEEHSIDILIGTQMIAKGLDFKKLTAVGLVLADVGFNMPDFRATERTFQLLTQVSGRAGRHVLSGGKVIVQTYNPEYPSIEFSKKANFTDFADYELKLREELNYPPFGKLALLRIISKDVGDGADASERLEHRAQQLKKQNQHYSKIQILGPCEAPIAKLRNKFRFHILLKTTSPNILSSFCRQLIGGESWLKSGTKVQVDIDPINLL
jgi:primosomal protein N' (replication factor Y)